MTNWLSIEKETIFTGKDENGNRYLSRFLKEYQETFNPDMINAGCSRCLEDYYQKFTKYLLKMGTKVKTESGYVLKAKYNGIPLKFGSRKLVTNATITKEQGDYLLKNHKRGADLFDKVPDNSGDEKPLSKMNREELDAVAKDLNLNPEDYSNKGDITKAIQEAQQTADNSGDENSTGDEPEE